MDGKRRKQKKQYTTADFKYPQSLLKIHSLGIVYRSWKWFQKYHPLIEFKRDNPRKEERAAIQAAKQAAISRVRKLPRNHKNNR